jgi:hypothetical protein
MDDDACVSLFGWSLAGQLAAQPGNNMDPAYAPVRLEL